MADIKSTIELMMERTQGLRLSDEERKKLRDEELDKKSRGVKLRIVDDPENWLDYVNAAELSSEADRNELKDLVWKHLIDDIPEDNEVFKYLYIIEKIRYFPDTQSKIEHFKHELRASMKDAVVDKKKILNKERKKLAAAGISGDAVVPKLPNELPVSGEFVDIIRKYKRELVKAD